MPYQLSPADRAILFEPNPYTYESTVTDPTQPPSPFVQVMREQEERFFAAFPEARRAAEYRARRKADLLAFLASQQQAEPTRFDSQLATPHSHFQASHKYAPSTPVLSHPSPPHSFTPPHTPNMHDDVPELAPAIPITYYHTQDGHSYDPPQIEATTKTVTRPHPQPLSPTHHDRHPKAGQQDSGSQQIKSHPSTSTISRDRRDRRSRSRTSTPVPRPRSQKRSTATPSKRRGATARKSPSPGKRQRQQVDSRKPTLACLFCRGRKIACGAPLPGSMGKTCNQCQRRSLPCEFPVESRRGMRKRRILNGSDEGADDLVCESILSP